MGRIIPPSSRSTGRRQASDPTLKNRIRKSLQNLREHYRRGVNSNTLRKERRFARVYSQQEFEEFCLLRRDDGQPLHWGHVIYLITINDQKKRKQMQRRAADNDWSAPELYAAMRRESDSKLGMVIFPTKSGQLNWIVRMA